MSAFAEPEHRLYYQNASTTFSTSLPLGNGRFGASVLSSPAQETFILNEVTFWSGASHTAGSGLARRPADPKAELRKTQQCLLRGDFAQAKQRSQQYLESEKSNFGTNLAVGHLDIAVQGHHGETTGFQRQLRLDEAVAETQYTADGHHFRRRCFVSHPHQVLVATFETSDPRGLALTVSLRGDGDNAFATRVQDQRLHFEAQALENVHSDGKSGVTGHGVVALTGQDVRVEERGGKLAVSGTKSITMFLAFATNYQETGDQWQVKASQQIDAVQRMSIEDVLASHLADYQPIYQRTSLTLGSSADSETNLPTDERRKQLKGPGYAGDTGIFALYFHLARYLTIAGTRADSPLPLHLQGLWNDGEASRMGWSCDYHLDINTQMNYYPTLPSGIPESMQPLVTYIQSLAAAGQDAARACYGCTGWVAHVFSNVWGFADPGWELTYGLNITGGLWLAIQLIEMYEYSLDDRFLRDTAYPVLKGAADFFIDYMIEDPHTGWLLTAPSISPENSFFVQVDGKEKQEHSIHLSPTLDVILLRDLFAFCSHAATHLGIDADFAQKMDAAMEKLPPLQIGKHGQLQEWLDDFEEAQPFHRHLSHTMALCRSAQISTRHTPDLARAVRTSLDRRKEDLEGLEDIEFTAALFGLNYARLGDAEKAVDEIGHLIQHLSFDNLLSYSKSGVAGAEENIFVIDGNFGGAAVIMEMLVRSLMPCLKGPVEVDLLPALPRAWTEGKAHGFRLRGGLEVDLVWSRGSLDKATFKATAAGQIEVHYGENTFTTDYLPNDCFTLDPTLEIIS